MPTYENNKDIRFQMFPGQRRKIVLEKLVCNTKKNNPNSVFTLRMPLTGQPLIGFPSFISSAYNAVEPEGSYTTSATLGDFELPGMTLEFFRNEDSKKRLLGMTGKTLFKFHVEREKDGDAYITVLRFSVRTEETVARLRWWHDMSGTDQWVDFVPTADALKESDDRQMSLADDVNQEDDGEDDETDDDMPEQDDERADAVSEDED